MAPGEGSSGPAFRMSTFRLAPGRTLVGVSVRADSAAKVGALWDHLMRGGVGVQGSMLNACPEGFEALAILDLTEVGREVGLELLRGTPLKGVEVEVIDSGIEGFASIGGHVLESGGHRSVIFSRNTVLGFLRGMRELMGEAAGAAFLYHAGFVSGREWGRYLAGRARDAREALAINLEVMKSHGLATSVAVLEGEGRYRFEARDLFECDLLSGYAAERGGRLRTSHWFRGALAGFLSEVMGGEWDVEEVECVNDGSDRCAFEARR
ncbi:MAG: V4R domain-containing protein, partial [Conexivisphaera sp.]